MDLDDYPEHRWALLPTCQVDPALLVITLHDLSAEHLEREDSRPIHVDARTGEFRVADGRHRALRAAMHREFVLARVLTRTHQP